MLCDWFRPRSRLEAEILVLRYQLNILQQRATPRRLHLRWLDLVVFSGSIGVARAPLMPSPSSSPRRWGAGIAKGFTAYWRWKSRSLGGRPRIAQEVRDLIRRMSLENPLWGVTKMHGELLKLGIRVARSTVSIYM